MMTGKISRINNKNGEPTFPVTSSKAVYMEDGVTTVENKIKDVSSELDAIQAQIENGEIGGGSPIYIGQTEPSDKNSVWYFFDEGTLSYGLDFVPYINKMADGSGKSVGKFNYLKNGANLLTSYSTINNTIVQDLSIPQESINVNNNQFESDYSLNIVNNITPPIKTLSEDLSLEIVMKPKSLTNEIANIGAFSIRLNNGYVEVYYNSTLQLTSSVQLSLSNEYNICFSKSNTWIFLIINGDYTNRVEKNISCPILNNSIVFKNMYLYCFRVYNEDIGGRKLPSSSIAIIEHNYKAKKKPVGYYLSSNLIYDYNCKYRNGIDNNPNYNLSRTLKDTDGNVLNAHGVGVTYHNGKYYMFGEDKSGKSTIGRVDVVGVSCYSSEDLKSWKYEGNVLPANTTDSNSIIHTSKVLERPKVLYNEKNNNFVMFFHADNSNYSFAQVGIAVSNTINGQYTLLGSWLPNNVGVTARDLTVFKDDDGKAYLFVSQDSNKSMYVHELNSDYTGFTGNYAVILTNGNRESPAVFKKDGNYYLITSGLTGWNPNQCTMHTSTSIMGTWSVVNDTFIGDGIASTWWSQISHVLKIEHGENLGEYIAIFDHWDSFNLYNSRLLILPIVNLKIDIGYGGL